MTALSRRRLLSSAAVVGLVGLVGCAPGQTVNADIQQAETFVQGILGSFLNEEGIIASLFPSETVLLGQLGLYSAALKGALSTLGSELGGTTTGAQTTIQAIVTDIDAFCGAALTFLKGVGSDPTVQAIIVVLEAAQTLIPVLLQLVGLIVPLVGARLAAGSLGMTSAQQRAWDIVQQAAARR